MAILTAAQTNPKRVLTETNFRDQGLWGFVKAQWPGSGPDVRESKQGTCATDIVIMHVVVVVSHRRL